MLKNYLNIAFRHLWKDRLYSLINIVGLAAATLCLILAVVYWNDEHSFDGFHANNPNLYRVTTTFIDKKGADPKIVGVTAFIPWVKMFSYVENQEKQLKFHILFQPMPFLPLNAFPVLAVELSRPERSEV